MISAVDKNGITDACSTADCCLLSTICPRAGYQRLPLDGAVIGTFEYCSVCSDWTTVVFWGNSLVKLIIANVSQYFPYNIQQFPNVLQKYWTEISGKPILRAAAVLIRVKFSKKLDNFGNFLYRFAHYFVQSCRDRCFRTFWQSFHRVAKCHRYGRLICVNFLEVWGKILKCNIRASDVG